jgi:DNA-binding transcriptional ArsR family regulator
MTVSLAGCDGPTLVPIELLAIRVRRDRKYVFSLLPKHAVANYRPRMALSHPLPPIVVELVARRFRTLGDPIRIRLLEHLREGEASMAELVSLSDTTPQNVSKHLSVLMQNGLVERRKRGTASYYQVADESIYAVCEQVCESIDRQVSVLGEVVAASRA